MSHTILLVGGGTGGHLFPLYPLAQNLIKKKQTVHLMVNDAPLDRHLIADKFADLTALKVHYLKTEKIDYHVSLRNLVAPFKIIHSFIRTKKLIKKIQPDIVFFKGGFVGFPVLVVLKYLMKFKGKIYLHDSDISAGKLTQIIGKSADKVFTNFGENPTPLFYWPEKVETGLVEFGDRSLVSKPKILIFGGSQGAQFLNHLIIQNVKKLAKKYHVILVTGPKNHVDIQTSNVEIFSFMPQDKLIETMIEADLVICRSGASMFQVLAAKTKCIAIPLPTAARNHQFENAHYFKSKQLCYLLEQNAQTSDKLRPMIEQILADQRLQQNLENYQGLPKTEIITQQIMTS